MVRPKPGLVLTDILILLAAYLSMAFVKGGEGYLSGQYLLGFIIVLLLWIINSFYLKKYQIVKKEKPLFLLRTIVNSNLLTLAFVAFIIYAFNTTFYSRIMVFGTFGTASVLELLVFGFYAYALRAPQLEDARSFLEKPLTNHERKKISETVVHSDFLDTKMYLKAAVLEECGEKVADYMEKHANLESPRTLLLSTTTRFNILKQPDNTYDTIINLKRVNDIQYLNKFFEAVNHKIEGNGLFFGTAETKNQRKRRILRKFPPIFNWLAYLIDYIIKRILPKTKLTMKLYFFLTRGNNRVLTKAEILGRLYSCGFEVLDDRYSNGLFVFTARKVKEPAFDMQPTYGPFVKLRRVGKDGELINVYKLRTMHPYAEYLQEYIHKKHDLAEGGKIKNDFRVSTTGKIFRALWLDELPMVFNLFTGELKLVGVRPLSKHYFDLYTKDLQELRVKTKPGLVPPFYYDLPKTLEEIQESERKYLESYLKKPFQTDWKYFWGAFINIVFKRARSA